MTTELFYEFGDTDNELYTWEFMDIHFLERSYISSDRLFLFFRDKHGMELELRFLYETKVDAQTAQKRFRTAWNERHQSKVVEFEEQKQKIDMILEKINKIYYAPSMPGFLEAQADFDQLRLAE
jgi:hypothetical protein